MVNTVGLRELSRSPSAESDLTKRGRICGDVAPVNGAVSGSHADAEVCIRCGVYRSTHNESLPLVAFETLK